MKKTILLPFLFCALVSMGQVTLSSSNLPIIILNTSGQEIPDDPKITATMGIIDNGPGNQNHITDPFNGYNGRIGIELRGSSSQQFPMKSYGLELRDSTGNQIDQSLFGLPKESDWILYAPYTDKTLMRNFLAYTMSRELGHWSPHCRYVEVMLNGQYIGIYVFMEKIKRGDGRVPIAKLKSSDNSGDAVTGGYIFSIDKDPVSWYSSFPPPDAPGAAIRFSMVYPKPADITPAQKTYIQSQVDSFENALAGPDFQDSVKGFRSFIDERSFIDYFIVNEVSRNVDAYRLSSFFYKDKDSKNPKIFAGPVWDYDLAFRNVNYCNGSNTDGWAYGFNALCSTDFWQVPFWWNRFLRDTAFRSNLYCRWTESRHAAISENHLYQLIDSVVALTAEARERHFSKWNILGTYVWPNPQPIPPDYAGEISTLKTWIHDRLYWIDANLDKRGICAPLLTDSFEIRAWPNPTSGAFVLGVNVPTSQHVVFQIVRTEGKLVFRGEADLTPGMNQIPLNTSGWPIGVYFIRVYFDSGVKKTFKVLKQ